MSDVPMSDISTKIRDYIVTTFLFGNRSKLDDETSFLENSILDSTGMLELISFIEQEFVLSIDPSELVPDNLDSIKNVTEFIQRKKGIGTLGEAA
jgi:acyl carrier protein